MQCPHCGSEFAATSHQFALGEDQSGAWQVSSTRCSMCDRLIVTLGLGSGEVYPAWPPASTRQHLCEDIPSKYADDYHAACQVLPFSPESSAALSRRLLQRLLVDQSGAGEGALVDQIRRSVLSPGLPEFLRQGLLTYSRLSGLESDAAKSEHPDALAAVKPGEAHWLLDVLQPMLDLFFVQPARLRRKQALLEDELSPASQAITPEIPAE